MMPRVVNTSNNDTAQSVQIPEIHVEEEENKNDENSNQHFSNVSPSRITKPPSPPFFTNYSHNNTITTHVDDDPYSLRCIIDGKVKKFKKDTRVWLHKSSAKVKLKCIEQALKAENGIESGSSSEKIFEIKRSVEIKKSIDETIETVIANSRKYTAETVGVPPCPVYVEKRTDNYDQYRSSTYLTDEDSEMSCIGDSDADLTYSEASTPTKTLSYVESWRQIGNEAMAIRTPSETSSVSGLDLCASVDCDADNGEELVDWPITSNRGHHGNLDTANESGNNIRCAPTRLDISHKIAPAIDIENESFKESLLDCAVNHFTKEVPDKQRIYYTRSCKGQKGPSILTSHCSPGIRKITFQKTSKPKKNDDKIHSSRVNYQLRSKIFLSIQEKDIQENDLKSTKKRSVTYLASNSIGNNSKQSERIPNCVLKVSQLTSGHDVGHEKKPSTSGPGTNAYRFLGAGPEKQRSTSGNPVPVNTSGDSTIRKPTLDISPDEQINTSGSSTSGNTVPDVGPEKQPSISVQSAPFVNTVPTLFNTAGFYLYRNMTNDNIDMGNVNNK